MFLISDQNIVKWFSPHVVSQKDVAYMKSPTKKSIAKVEKKKRLI